MSPPHLTAAMAMPQAVRYSATSYVAFLIGETGTYPLDPLDAGSLEEALNEVVAKHALSHKQHLVVREDGDRGTTLHIFAVKQRSAPRYVYKDYRTRAVRDLYLAPVCSLDGKVLG